MEKTQREYYLNEQLKAIQKELGEIEDGKDETSSLNKAITKLNKVFLGVLKRLIFLNSSFEIIIKKAKPHR